MAVFNGCMMHHAMWPVPVASQLSMAITTWTIVAIAYTIQHLVKFSYDHYMVECTSRLRAGPIHAHSAHVEFDVIMAILCAVSMSYFVLNWIQGIPAHVHLVISAKRLTTGYKALSQQH